MTGTQRAHMDRTPSENVDLDAQLMLRVKEGDTASFGVLLEKHRTPVIHFLFRMVQDNSISEELAQEVFFRVYRSRLSYEPTAKFTTWLFRIATHLALNWLRDGKRERGKRGLTMSLSAPRPCKFPTVSPASNNLSCTKRASKRCAARFIPFRPSNEQRF